MGLESHVRCELERAASGKVFGEDYWFENGLTVETLVAANEIADILDATGEFGPTTVVEVPTPKYITTRKKTFKIEFGIHPQFQRRETGDDMKPIPVYPNEWGVK